MRSSLVPGSEGGERGWEREAVQAECAPQSLDNWTCTRAGAGGGFWLGYCHSHKGYRRNDATASF